MSIFDRDPNVKINMVAKIQDGRQNGCQLFFTSENQLFQRFLISLMMLTETIFEH